MNRALFLDRDGVINVEKNYVHRIEDFEFVDGIFELCAGAQAHGFKLIVITNQAGIARGYYTVAEFEQLTEWMVGQFAERGITIDRVYYCPHHPTEGIGEFQRDSFDRKPNPGMILRARDDFDLELAMSVLVGDKDSDIEAGRKAGVGRIVQLIHHADPIHGSKHLVFPSLDKVLSWLEVQMSSTYRMA